MPGVTVFSNCELPGQHPLTKNSYCRKCGMRQNTTSPDAEQRRIERLRAKCAQPEFRAKMSEAAKATYAIKSQDPEWMARRRAWCAQASKNNLEVGRYDPAVRAKAAKSIRARHLSWCPPEYWPFNETLKRNGYLLPERKVMIAEEVRRNDPVTKARRQIAEFDTRQRERAAREKAQAY